MRRSGILFPLVAGLALLLSYSCKNNEETGRLVVKITDAPFPVSWIDEANVTITKVEIRSKDDTAGFPFLTIFEDEMEFNLLSLRNGVTAELLDREIPVGNYDLVRLYLKDASISVKDYNSYCVQVPSGFVTGIKIFIKPSIQVAGGLTSELLLDFNVDSSFVLNGKLNTPASIKGFNFKPVIRAVNNSVAGSVTGVVMDVDSIPLAEAEVWIGQDTVVTTAYTDETGFYGMPGILAGTYSISAVKEGFDTLRVDDLDVIEANLTRQDFYLEPAESDPLE